MFGDCREGAAGGSGSCDTSGAEAVIDIPLILRRAESDPCATGEIGSMMPSFIALGCKLPGALFETTLFRRFLVEELIVSKTGPPFSIFNPVGRTLIVLREPWNCGCTHGGLRCKATALRHGTAANPFTGSGKTFVTSGVPP